VTHHHAGAAGADGIAFIVMWAVMMIAMMLPVVATRLLRHGREAGVAAAALFALAYFGVWIAVGLLVPPLQHGFGQASARLPGLAGAVPWLTGLAIVLAGAVQLTPWKQRALACCRAADPLDLPPWRAGLRLGLRCVKCCANLTGVLLVLGVMELPAMVAVTALIALERLAPGGRGWARASGAGLVLFGLSLPASARLLAG